MRLFITLLCAFLLTSAGAQKEILFCGQTEATQKIFERFPHLTETIAQDEADLESFTQGFIENRGGNQVYIIPVVFHIIHNNGPENISDDQVYDAVNILNRDMRMLNEDIEDVVESFEDITADIEIEFRLAQIDPWGNCTKGITRIVSPLTYEGDSEMKALVQWPREQYMNVWVSSYANGAAGYTYLPGSVNNWQMESEDGIVLKHDYTGSIGTGSVSRSRTLTHEVGHWLNLRHCWGAGNSPGDAENCDMDDNVSDTPLTLGWTSCALSGTSCGSLDNVQNYMEYSYCGRMFTEGQKTRMRAAAQSNTADRNDLWTQSNLIATGVFNDSQVLCKAEFSTPRTVVCVGEELPFLDTSFNGVTEWSWNFGDGNTVAGADPEIHQHPVHVYNEPGSYAVTLTVGNGSDEVSETMEEYIRVLAPGELIDPFAEGFEDSFPGQNWFVDDILEDGTWEQTSDADYSGSHSLRIENYFNTTTNNVDQFISSTIDLSDAEVAIVSYKWAFALKSTNSDDRLRIYVSGDCGDNWWVFAIHRGFTDLPSASSTNSYFVPGSADWDYDSFEITDPEFLTENVRIKFEFTGKGGNNLYMDDINIMNAADVSVDEVKFESSVKIWPNPSNGDAILSVGLDNGSLVQANLTNLMGQQIRNLANGIYEAGTLELALERGSLAAGVYFVNLTVDGFTTARKWIVK